MPIKAENNVVRFLAQHGKISQQQFKELVAEAREVGVPADILIEKKNILSDEDIAWAKGKIYGVPVADLYGFSVDKNILNFGESLTLQIKISGDVANIPKPQLPQITGFNVYSSGTSQNYSFINGRVSSSKTFNFILSPTRPGKFTIAPVTLKIGAKIYSTEPINIEVRSAAVLPRQNIKSPQGHQPQRTIPGVKNNEDAPLFIRINLDKKKAFVNEGITYTFKFFTSKNLFSQPQYTPPNFTGFIVEDLPPQKNYQTTINGKLYNVIEIKTKLFPLNLMLL